MTRGSRLPAQLNRAQNSSAFSSGPYKAQPVSTSSSPPLRQRPTTQALASPNSSKPSPTQIQLPLAAAVMPFTPGPYSGVSTLALVARASAFSVGVVYGSIKLSILKATKPKKEEAHAHH